MLEVGEVSCLLVGLGVFYGCLGMCQDCVYFRTDAYLVSFVLKKFWGQKFLRLRELKKNVWFESICRKEIGEKTSQCIQWRIHFVSMTWIGSLLDEAMLNVS